MPTRYWADVINVSVPLGLGSGTTGSSPVAIATASDDASTLLRTGMFGSFFVYEDPTNTTTYPVAGWETELEAWVGLWSDGGDAGLTVPTDPFDTPNPDPGWLSTCLLYPATQAAVTPRHTLSSQLSLPKEGIWSKGERKTRSAPPGTFQTVYFCWTFDSQSLPLPGTSSGGVDYKAGMNFWFRVLFETP